MAAQEFFPNVESNFEQDITVKIEKDHNLVRSLYKDYKSTTDLDARKTILDNIIKNIAQHSAAEEMALYSDYSKLLGDDGKLIADSSWKEHEDVKKMLYEIDQMSKVSMDDPKLNLLLEQLFTDLEHHMKEEEEDYLPKLRKEVSSERLIKLGASFDAFKLNAAPTRPHPSAPDKGVTGIVVNAMTKPLDELRDAIDGKRVL